MPNMKSGYEVTVFVPADPRDIPEMSRITALVSDVTKNSALLQSLIPEIARPVQITARFVSRRAGGSQ